MAALPSAIALQVERLICGHRRSRKDLVGSQPNGWQEKLKKVNGQVMTIVWHRNSAAVAASSYIKKSTRMVNGELQFYQGTGKGYELLRLRFFADVEDEVDGPGKYWISSENYPAREVCCQNANAERNGFDLLREYYAGHSG